MGEEKELKRKDTEEKCKRTLMKAFLKPRRKELRQRFLKQPNFWGTISSFLCAVILLVLSFWLHLRRYEWLPNAFLSIACGVITGLVLYFLTNIRTNRLIRVQEDLESLRTMETPLQDIFNMKLSCQWRWSPLDNEFGVTDMGLQVLEDLETLDRAHYNMSHRLFEKLGFNIDDPFDRDKLSEMKAGLENAGDNEKLIRKWIIDIEQIIEPVLDKVRSCLSEEKDALMFLGKFFF